MKNTENRPASQLSSNHIPQQELDAQIKAMLESGLPDAPDNEWFLPKVMHRLPEKRGRLRASLPEKICYAVGVILLIASWVYAITFTNANGVSQTTFLMAAILPVVTFFCIGIFTLPVIRRVL